MAKKLITLDEAAKMLGVSSETLNEMRERQRIYGYRDGGSWKFKPEDVERLIADRDSAEEEGEFAEMDEDPDSILLSEVELGQSGESTSSTIIGGRTSRERSDDDMLLAETSDITPTKAEPPKKELKKEPKKEAKKQPPANKKSPADSDVQLAPDDDHALSMDSSLAADLASGSDVLKGGSGVSPLFDELDTLDLEMESAADSGIFSGTKPGSGAGSALELGSALDLGSDAGGSALSLGSDALKFEEGSKLSLGGEDDLALGEAAGMELDLEDAKDGGSAIDLAGDEDGDLVLGGSSHGDLSRSGDSGISLLDPADSGLSLDSPPLELGGSAVESLELGEDDMILVDDAAKSGVAGGSEASGQGEDDFLLAPLEEASAEESDSGSQVIVLVGDDESDAAATAPGLSSIGEGPISGVLEDDLGATLGAAASGVSLAAAAAPAGRPGAAAPAAAMVAGGAVAAPEAQFTGWNVVSLVFCVLLLMLCAMFMFDLLRNMWSWNQPYTVNSSMMDMVLSWFE